MPDKPGVLTRVTARIRALLPRHWRGHAGQRFRETITTISEFTKEHVRVAERVQEAPDVLWDTLREKGSRALVNVADEEQKRIAIELARVTLRDKARQERATADRLETEAKIIKIHELEARFALIEKLRTLNVVPVLDSNGTMTLVRMPADYDWEGLVSRLLSATDLSLPD